MMINKKIQPTVRYGCLFPLVLPLFLSHTFFLKRERERERERTREREIERERKNNNIDIQKVIIINIL